MNVAGRHDRQDDFAKTDRRGLPECRLGSTSLIRHAFILGRLSSLGSGVVASAHPKVVYNAINSRKSCIRVRSSATAVRMPEAISEIAYGWARGADGVHPRRRAKFQIGAEPGLPAVFDRRRSGRRRGVQHTLRSAWRRGADRATGRRARPRHRLFFVFEPFRGCKVAVYVMHCMHGGFRLFEGDFLRNCGITDHDSYSGRAARVPAPDAGKGSLIPASPRREASL